MEAYNGACLILSASLSAAESRLSMRPTVSKVFLICIESSSSDMSRLSTTLSRVVLDHDSPWECFGVRVVEGSSAGRTGSLPLRERLERGLVGVCGRSGRSWSSEIEYAVVVVAAV
jgi:hypothetical protein